MSVRVSEVSARVRGWVSGYKSGTALGELHVSSEQFFTNLLLPSLSGVCRLSDIKSKIPPNYNKELYEPNKKCVGGTPDLLTLLVTSKFVDCKRETTENTGEDARRERPIEAWRKGSLFPYYGQGSHSQESGKS